MASNNTYYRNQLITYLGNKRNLISYIEQIVDKLVQEKIKKPRENLSMADLFSGSGVVSRMLKSKAENLYVNDFEPYCKVINECFLTNREDFDDDLYDYYYQKIMDFPKVENGIIRRLYSPKNDKSIKKNDRCFYTNENAILIDTYRAAIENQVPKEYQKFFLASLLYGASVHVNTGGMFKGFYKNKVTKIGQFGGTGENALKRIKGQIELQKPILSDYFSNVHIYQQDTNQLVKTLPKVDIAYIDSPYNEHPYGSNYFMLNLILENKEPKQTSKVSGIPTDWKKSDYYKKDAALKAMDDLIANVKARFVILSYSSDGIISQSDLEAIFNKYCKEVEKKEIHYVVLRSGRKTETQKQKQLNEFLYILEKKI